jgi:hypothetical protein
MSKKFNSIKKGLTEAIEDADGGARTICRKYPRSSSTTHSQRGRIDVSMEL